MDNPDTFFTRFVTLFERELTKHRAVYKDNPPGIGTVGRGNQVEIYLSYVPASMGHPYTIVIHNLDPEETQARVQFMDNTLKLAEFESRDGITGIPRLTKLAFEFLTRDTRLEKEYLQYRQPHEEMDAAAWIPYYPLKSQEQSDTIPEMGDTPYLGATCLIEINGVKQTQRYYFAHVGPMGIMLNSLPVFIPEDCSALIDPKTVTAYKLEMMTEAEMNTDHLPMDNLYTVHK